MRKSFQGLLALVQCVFAQHDPCSGSLFVFVNRCGNYIKISYSSAECMLAMKTLAMRICEGYYDEDDARYLVRNLGLRTFGDAEEILARYYSLEEFPASGLIALGELLSE